MNNSEKDDIWDNLLSNESDNKRFIIFEDSSTLKEARYDRLMQTLTIIFKTSTGTYSYFDVPSDVAVALFSCEKQGISAGKYFIKHIKHKYPFKRIS